MLFDLRGRGRRNTIRIIYIGLAFLMGGGLVLFGIGGGTALQGGLVDAITGAGGGTDVAEERFEKLEREALARTQRNPRDEAAWIQLVRARVQLSTSGDRYDADKGTYTAAGTRELREAADAWEKYLAIDPTNRQEQARVAGLMVRAYLALGETRQAARAQEIVAEVRDAAGPYSQLAALSYEAGDIRKGDLAAKKALALTDKDQRETLKAQLDSAKQQAVVNQVTPQTTPQG
ncbi:MAG TPA: hypothetical protein VM266_17175 [Solirubrobacteraceae bacterium]|nr:hypothetical protein [Solirubrobacteraceae bacterium]